MITCSFEDGGKALLRHVTLDALIIRDNKILLEKRAPHLSNPGKFCLPGGYLNRDETASSGVQREVKEETGYEPLKAELLWVNDNPNRAQEDRQNVSLVFLVQVGEKNGESDHEVSEVSWFDLGNLPPQEQFAFDHYEQIQRYLRSQT